MDVVVKLIPAAARVLAFLPLFVTLLPLTRSGRGLVRIWDFPRMQIAVAAAIAAASLRYASRRKKADQFLIVSLSLAAAYQLRKVLPYTPLHRKQMRDANPEDRASLRRIRLVIANVYMHNRQFDLMRQVIEEADADVICLVEPDGKWQVSMEPLKSRYPHILECPLDNTCGMLLYSRLPLLEPGIRFLVEEGVPSMKTRIQLRSGDRVDLRCLHPRPPRPTHASDNRDAELVLVAREIDRDRTPCIVIGDLNDVAWSYTTTLFQRISRTLDPRIGRGMYNSYNANYPLLRYPLDHAFATREFALVELRRLRHAGSDHFPLLAEFSFNPKHAGEKSPPGTDGYDTAQTREILDDCR